MDTRKSDRDEAAAMESSALVEEQLQEAMDNLQEKRWATESATAGAQACVE